MDDFRDYYEILQVHHLAEGEVIKRAYRVLISSAHPDAGGDLERTKLLNEAYEVLSDPARRAAYNIEWGARRMHSAYDDRTSHAEEGRSDSKERPEYTIRKEYVTPVADAAIREAANVAVTGATRAAKGVGKGLATFFALMIGGFLLLVLLGNAVAVGSFGGLVFMLLALFVGAIALISFSARSGVQVAANSIRNKWLVEYVEVASAPEYRQRRWIDLKPLERLLQSRDPRTVTLVEYETLVNEYRSAYGSESGDWFSQEVETFLEYVGYSDAEVTPAPVATTAWVDPTTEERLEMSRYGVTFAGGMYQYSGYRYERLKDALAYARLVEERAS